MITDTVIALLAGQAAGALANVIRHRLKAKSLSVQFADGQELVVGPSTIMHLAAHGHPGGHTRPTLADEHVFTAEELVQLVAASRNALERSPTGTELESDDQLYLSVPNVSDALVNAYAQILGEEYPWVSSADLALAAEFFAMRDSGGVLLATEWDEISEDAELLKAFVKSPAIHLQQSAR